MKKALTYTAVLVMAVLPLTACSTTKEVVNSEALAPSTAQVSVNDINSFNMEVACSQALEVINNNPYSEPLFEQTFAKLIQQSKSSISQDNADTIWNHFIEPLKLSGKVPPALAVTTWNYHFAQSFVSLPDSAPAHHYCRQLSHIKQNMEKEYHSKQLGFQATNQGSVDGHFLNAMYVYNTMWASCHDSDSTR